MLDLPKSTELYKALTKKVLYEKFSMSSAEKERFDADISRITIVHEISPATVNIVEGEDIKTFFVMLVVLKKKDFDERTIITLSKLVHQNMLFVLDFDSEEKLAVYYTKLLQTDWRPKESTSLLLKGLNLDVVWENVIIQVGGIKIEHNYTLDEQIALHVEQEKVTKEIARLEKLAAKERQPKKKFEIVMEMQKLKKELEG